MGPHLVVNNWLASWSGTSFATPIVAGAIAHRMAVHNETAPVAWAALKLAADQKRRAAVSRRFPDRVGLRHPSETAAGAAPVRDHGRTVG